MALNPFLDVVATLSKEQWAAAEVPRCGAWLMDRIIRQKIDLLCVFWLMRETWDPEETQTKMGEKLVNAIKNGRMVLDQTGNLLVVRQERFSLSVSVQTHEGFLDKTFTLHFM